MSVEEAPWLSGPTGGVEVVGSRWLDDFTVEVDGVQRHAAGLIPSVAALVSEDFDPDRLRPEVVHFYEHTSEYLLDVWSQWSRLMWPGGWLISSLFARRLEQLSLPLRPLDAAYGMDSEVIAVDDSTGEQMGAAWLRTMRSTGAPVYSGWYGSTNLPGERGPAVRVVFPLPNGSCIVLLRPRNGPNGSLLLESPLGSFGEPGAYLVVNSSSRHIDARRVPLNERFEVFVDARGELRTDHHLKLWHTSVIRFHYRLTPTTPPKHRSRQ